MGNACRKHFPAQGLHLLMDGFNTTHCEVSRFRQVRHMLQTHFRQVANVMTYLVTQLLTVQYMGKTYTAMFIQFVPTPCWACATESDTLFSTISTYMYFCTKKTSICIMCTRHLPIWHWHQIDGTINCLNRHVCKISHHDAGFNCMSISMIRTIFVNTCTGITYFSTRVYIFGKCTIKIMAESLIYIYYMNLIK